MLKLSWCTIHIPSGTVIDVAFQYGMDETLQGQIKYSFLLIIISHHQVESRLDVRLVSISTGCCISQLSRYIVLQAQLQHLYNHLCYTRILSITSISIILLALYHIQPKNAMHNRPQTERNVTILCIVFLYKQTDCFAFNFQRKKTKWLFGGCLTIQARRFASRSSTRQTNSLNSDKKVNLKPSD